MLVWVIGDPSRLTAAAREHITSGTEQLFLSSVTAFEYSDLHSRGRLAEAARLDLVIDAFDLTVLDTPADLWKLAAALPTHHGDPVDRMLIAHAIHADLTLVTADKTMRDYPVRTVW